MPPAFGPYATIDDRRTDGIRVKCILWQRHPKGDQDPVTNGIHTSLKYPLTWADTPNGLKHGRPSCSVNVATALAMRMCLCITAPCPIETPSLTAIFELLDYANFVLHFAIPFVGRRKTTDLILHAYGPSARIGKTAMRAHRDFRLAVPRSRIRS